MNKYLTILLVLGLISVSSQAQQSAPAPAAPEMPKMAIANADDEAYAGLVKGELELNTQFNLLSDLGQEHRKRAEEATKANQTDKARWESELQKELSDRSAATLRQISDLTKQRQAFEQTHKNAAVSAASLNAASATTRLSSREIEFLSKIDEQLDKLDQELVATRQYGIDYASQMVTNTTAYDHERMGGILEENTRRMRQLEQELFDLKLRKLEFEALRKR